MKVVVLGLDGLDFSMLPMLPSLPSNSIRAKLDSLIPLTFPSWASIMTGVNPGKHGIYGFFKYKKVGGRWKAFAVSAYDVKYPRVHEALALARVPVKSLIIGPMPPYPCLPCKNSDILSITQFFKPDYTSAEVLNKLYHFEEIMSAIEALKRPNTCTALLEIALRILDAHIAALENLWSMEGCYDFLWLYVNLPDTYLHRCPQALNKRNKLLKPLFDKLDVLVKKSLSLSDNLIVVSDHGFKKFRYVVRVNRILYDHGFAKAGKGGIIDVHQVRASTHRKEIIKIHPSIIPYIHRILPPSIRKLIRLLLSITRKALHKQITVSAPPRIDENESKAFMPIGSSPAIIGNIILLNDTSIAKEVVKILKGYGVDAYTANEILDGPFTPKDVVFVVQRDEYLPTSGTTYSDPVEEIPRVSHERYGTLAVKFDYMKCPKDIPEILPNSVVAPLILNKLNAPLGVEMDAKNIALMICGKDAKDVRYVRYQQLWNVYRKVLITRNKLRKRSF
ncbi:alkaline phosphatase family protein [Candidatus Bathyarchaeota archaeon]|nr:alkaline phosphatase family protein [Candidatus Bathyarchaeota archaeon]